MKMKQTPHSLEAEKGVLGTLLISDQLLPDLKPEDFYEPRHSIIFESISQLKEKREPVDLLTLSQDLSDKKKLKHAGGRSYLAEITEEVPSPNHLDSYAKTVKAKSIERQLSKLGNEMSDGLSLSEAQERISSIQLKAESKEPSKDVYDIIESYSEAYKKRQDGIIGLTTGYNEIDKKITFQKGQYITLAAKTGIGKSALSLTISLGAAKTQKVLFISMEMGENQLVNRILAHFTDTNAGVFKHASASEAKLEAGLEKLSKLENFRMSYSPGATTKSIHAEASRVKAKYGLDLLIVDYVQLIADPQVKGENRTNQLSKITRNLKLIAAELDVCVLVPCQVRRKPRGERIDLSDLRDSGSIEQDSDIVLAIERNYDEEETELVILKNREGGLGKIEMVFDAPTTTYKEIQKGFHDKLIESKQPLKDKANELFDN